MNTFLDFYKYLSIQINILLMCSFEAVKYSYNIRSSISQLSLSQTTISTTKKLSRHITNSPSIAPLKTPTHWKRNNKVCFQIGLLLPFNCSISFGFSYSRHQKLSSPYYIKTSLIRLKSQRFPLLVNVSDILLFIRIWYGKCRCLEKRR